MSYPPASNAWVRGSQLAGDVWRWMLPVRARTPAPEPLRAIIAPRPSAEAAREYGAGAWREVVAVADRIVAGAVRIFGASVALGPADDVWHRDWVTGRLMPRGYQRWLRRSALRARGDIKRVWEINRHQWLIPLAQASLLTGDARYAATARELLAAWIRANPPHQGVNWRDALELGIRLVAWWTALPLFEPKVETWPEWPDIARAMHEQLTAIENHLSYFSSPNTHLLGEGLALFLGGIILPHAARAATWRDRGKVILDAELERQVGADGGHREKSAYYHCYALEMFLLALVVGRRAGVSFSATWNQRLARMAEVLASLIRPDGSLAMIGDDDGGRLLPLSRSDYYHPRDLLYLAATVLERADLVQNSAAAERASAGWLLGRVGSDSAALPHDQSQRIWLEQMGVGTIRVGHDGRAGWCSLQAQPLGMLSAGHSHAGLGSIELSLGGRPILVDSGTYSYHETEWRDHFRRAAAHNALTIAGIEPFVPDAPFRMRDGGSAHGIRGQVSDGGVEIRYELRQGRAVARHSRQVSLIGAQRALIQDDVEVDGDETREIVWQWHLAPGCTAVAAPAQTFEVMGDEQVVARLRMYGTGLDGDTRRDWVSTSYGCREAGDVIVFKARVRGAAAFACEVTAVL